MNLLIKVVVMVSMKVYIPTHWKCEFENLNEVVEYVKHFYGGLPVFIAQIVFYNVRYRDCLREKGIDGVIKMLLNEAPDIAIDTKAIDALKRNWRERKHEYIADYDIQCLPKDARFCIEGNWFNGLEELGLRSELYGFPENMYFRWFVPQNYKYQPSNLHVGLIMERYPRFDSSDASDGRTYDNYVFSNVPLTEEMMEQYCNRIRKGCNACLVHEHIPEDLLPILYYDGDSNNVLLATKK